MKILEPRVFLLVICIDYKNYAFGLKLIAPVSEGYTRTGLEDGQGGCQR